jgi:hypothetical protein
VERIEIGLPQGPFAQPQFDRHIVEPSRSKTAMEMPQSWNNHPDNGNLHVRPGLVENQEIQAKTFGELDAGENLLAPIETGKF